MLNGWRNQQLSRNLQHSTINAREAAIRRFADSTDEYPWTWSPAHVDEFFGDLRAIRQVRLSTVRGYQTSLRLFCEYITSPSYGWPEACERYFGTHPVQVCFEWNTAAHVQDNESDPARRAFTRTELQRFFDRADDEVSGTARHWTCSCPSGAPLCPSRHSARGSVVTVTISTFPAH